MCGICGYLDFSGDKVSPDVIERMVDTFPYRGPDHKGIYCDGPVALGIQRLAIIDLSESANQPLASENERIWLIHNGEIYNFKSLREDLIAKEHRFRSESDSEVILHLYEERGVSCVEPLRGMFAFALWDSKRRHLLVTRDRLGIKPLYYAVTDGMFIFASEIKAILAHPDVRKEIDYLALSDYFKYQYIPGERTIFKNIRKLLPGHYIILRDNAMDIKCYWQLSFKPDYKKSDRQWKEETLGLLREAVNIRLISDVPLGVFLSGGLDSSAIVALVRENGSCRKLKTFTVGFERQGVMSGHYDERPYANIVAKKFDTEHYEFIVRENILDVLPEMVWHFDEPFANLTAIATYFISRLAKEHITVALAGVGGDENFGGYPRYAAARYLKHYLSLPPTAHSLFRKACALLSDNTSEYALSNRLRRFVAGTDTSLLRSYDKWISVFSDVQREALFTEVVKNALPGSAGKEYAPEGRDDTLNQIYRKDFSVYLPDNLLAYSDRMSMAASLELRVPFCDYKFVEFAATIPPEKKIKRGILKYLLKKSFADILPCEIINRRKQGFSIPPFYSQTEYLRGLFRRFFSKEYLAQQGIFNSKAIELMVNEHVTGKVNHLERLITLLVFQVWFDIYLKSPLTKPDYRLSEMVPV